jgi:predicted nucleic acid-binding protein
MAASASRVRDLLLAGDRAIVPPIWHPEVVNGLIIAERRGHLTSEDTVEALQRLEVVSDQAIETHQEQVSMTHLLQTARQFRLTAYDAAYLDIARELQVALATLDQQLAIAATKAGVELIR